MFIDFKNFFPPARLFSPARLLISYTFIDFLSFENPSFFVHTYRVKWVLMVEILKASLKILAVCITWKKEGTDRSHSWGKLICKLIQRSFIIVAAVESEIHSTKHYVLCKKMLFHFLLLIVTKWDRVHVIKWKRKILL